jgi:hypothetical protein
VRKARGPHSRERTWNTSVWIDLYFPFGSLHIFVEAETMKAVFFDATVLAALITLVGAVFTAVMAYVTYRRRDET